MKINDVLIRTWGKNQNNTILPKQKIKFPQETNITLNFDNENIVGKAKNFRTNSKGIICDVYLDEKPLNTIAPSFKINKSTFLDDVVRLDSVELIDLSLVNNHANKKCQSNLKKENKNEN